MKKPGIYTVTIKLPITAPYEFECMSFDYALWARNDEELSEEYEYLKKKLKLIGAWTDGVERKEATK